MYQGCVKDYLGFQVVLDFATNVLQPPMIPATVPISGVHQNLFRVRSRKDLQVSFCALTTFLNTVG
jgi:hypothetical protein